MLSNDYYLSIAIGIALTSKCKYKIGCIIIDKRGRILSTGVNKSKTHTLQFQYAKDINEKKIHLHAEIDAINNLKRASKPHAIYVARTSKIGDTRLAKPCSICMKAIIDNKIDNIYWTVNE